MTTTLCPVCDVPSEGPSNFPDSTQYICPRCGGYRLSGTAVELLANRTALERPDPDWFRDLVRRKRGDSDEYPVITTYDLGE
jgi:Zn-finger nucleic acid-binding protein